ncbi:MAG: RidA family protein [Pseudomonadota bacterium]
MTLSRMAPVAPQYSKVVRHAGTVYLAGLIAEDWDGDIVRQSNDIFSQIDDLLGQADTDKSKLLSLTVYIKTFEDYAAFKAAYADWIDADNLPARATVRADLLDPKLKIEIQAIAAA